MEGGGNGEKIDFLQPPHFRAPMDDDLLDQIASRFGRSALDVEQSALYKRMKRSAEGMWGGAADDYDDFDEEGNYVGDEDEVGGGAGGNGRAGANFRDRFQNYVQKLMGSTDLYCCPVCYIEADRRLGNIGDKEVEADDTDDDDGEGDDNKDKQKRQRNRPNGEESTPYRHSFLDDPLTILGNLDGEQFETASTFCFRLLTGLKHHLRVVHGVDPSEVEGNDLYKRFQIRASDGLLQRYLKKSLRRQTVQGDMMRYWLSGENQSFVLLMSHIDDRELRGVDAGEDAGASDFSLSFPNRARRVWDEVSSPYLKEAGEDMEEFLADDDEEEEGGEGGENGGGVPINPNFVPPAKGGMGAHDVLSPEDQIVEHLKEKNAETRRRHRREAGLDSSAEEEGGSSDDGASLSDELEVIAAKRGGANEADDGEKEEEVEEDEWIKSKRYKSKLPTERNSANNAPPSSSSEDERFSSPRGGDGDRRRVLESSDEEDK